MGSVSSWVIHDLRRTAATGMAEIGIQPHIIEAILNHLSGHKASVAGIYNRAHYASEKREALERWASHLKTSSVTRRSLRSAVAGHDPTPDCSSHLQGTARRGDHPRT